MDKATRMVHSFAFLGERERAFQYLTNDNALYA